MEIIDEVPGINVASVSLYGVEPGLVVIKDILKVLELVFDGSPLGLIDPIAIGIFEIEEAIILAGNIVVVLVVELVGRCLQDAIRSGSMEKLRTEGAVLGGKASYRNGIHSIDAEEPSTCAAVFG